MNFNKRGFRLYKLSVIWGPPANEIKVVSGNHSWEVKRFIGVMWGGVAIGLQLSTNFKETKDEAHNY